MLSFILAWDTLPFAMPPAVRREVFDPAVNMVGFDAASAMYFWDSGRAESSKVVPFVA
jgi:hypothetical protein